MAGISNSPSFSVNPLNSNQLLQKNGGGCAALFGLPFFCAGIFVIIITLGIIDIEGEVPPWFFGIPFGGVFAAVGGAFIFGRSMYVIDRKAKSVLKEYKILVTLKKTEEPFDGANAITINKEIRRSDKSTYTVYPIRISASDPINLSEPRVYESARQLAETLAEFLDLPLADSSSGETVTRNPDELNESLTDQLKKSGGVIDLPEQPYGILSTLKQKDQAVMVSVPSPGFTPGTWFQLGLSLVFPIFVCSIFLFPILSDQNMPKGVKMMFVSFLGLFFVLLPILAIGGSAIAAAKKRYRVIIEPSGIKILTQGMMSKSEKEISAAELEEIDIVASGGSLFGRRSSSASGGILLRSDTQTLSFGSHLTREELEYLAAVIKKTLLS